MKSLLANPDFYYYARHIATGGLPFKQWVSLYHLNQKKERIADIGCGPADMLRYVQKDSKPGYYLGVDISNEYLKQAQFKARSLDIPSDFISMDLERLTYDTTVQSELRGLIGEKKITTVLLLGVLHHIDNEAATATLNMVYDIPNVNFIITQDILIIPGNYINNFFASRDRGKFVRSEMEYDQLIQSTHWKNFQKIWTNPGIGNIKYLHYKLSRT